MKIYANEYKSETVADLILELNKNERICEYMRSRCLTQDWVELVANHIITTDTDFEDKNERVELVYQLLTGSGDGFDINKTGARDEGIVTAKDKFKYIKDCCTYNENFPVLDDSEIKEVINKINEWL